MFILASVLGHIFWFFLLQMWTGKYCMDMKVKTPLSFATSIITLVGRLLLHIWKEVSHVTCLFLLFLSAVPTLGPSVTSAVRTSTTTATLSWAALGHEMARGNVIGYSVRYRPMTSQDERCSASDANTWTAKPNTTSTTTLDIMGLDPKAAYCVAVAATTSVGTGPYGTPATIASKSTQLMKLVYSFCLSIYTSVYFWLLSLCLSSCINVDFKWQWTMGNVVH